jgi:ABC-2 type transport system permease protein
MWRMLYVLLRKEFTQIRRNPVILRAMLISPIMQLVLLANAATFEVKTSNLWVVDQDHSPASRGLVDRFVASGRFTVVGTSMITRLGDDALLDGRASTVLVVPGGFAGDVVRNRRATLQLILNAENGSQAGVLQGYAGQIIGRYADDLASTTPLGIVRPTIEVRSRAQYNQALDYKRFMVPGVLVQLLVMIGTLMTALNIVREKEVGTLEQLNVTPMKPGLFVAAKLIPLLTIGLVEFVFGMVVSIYVFDVPMLGSGLLLLVGATVFLLAALGLGLWVSTITETQTQALFVTFSMTMVYILMSGLFTPVRGMPDWVLVVAQANPLLHFIVMMRGVMLKGAGLSDVWPQMAALVGISVVVLMLAIGRYRKQTT